MGNAGSSNISGTTTLDDLKKMACAGWTGEPESVPSLLQFVVDTSGSMNDMTASTMGQTKWVVTRGALNTSLAQLPASTGVGLLLYPNMNINTRGGGTTGQGAAACVRTNALIPIAQLGAAGSAQRTTLTNAINAATAQSYTPTYDAYTSGFNLGLVPATLPGKRFMVLITDGAPTVQQGCVVGSGNGQVTPVDPAPIVTAIQTAHDQGGVDTFVIGSPGSDESINGTDARVAWLSAAARAGGTANPGCSDAGPNFCHVDLTTSSDFAAALLKSLNDIAGKVAVQCTYDLPKPPMGQTLDTGNINVIYTAGDGTQTLLGRSSDPACTDGWQLVGTQVQLCANTCSQVKADTKAGLQLLFGCGSVAQVK